MLQTPEILNNPHNPLYKLEEAEIYSIKEALELITIEKHSYALFAIWNATIINIQRRIESFGTANFINLVEGKEHFNKEGNNLKDRWLNINEFNLIDYALKLNVISHVAHDLITTLYWMKSITNEEELKDIDKEEIFSLLSLIEKNLFSKPFKEDKRKIEIQGQTDFNLKRRKIDREEINTSTIPNTHDELLLKSGVKVFSQNQKDEDEKSTHISAYI